MFLEQGSEKEISPVSRFRKHRHDILNQLQLIRAYVQVGREPDAIRIVDETARWLQSLTKWQTLCKENAERLVFAASNCPHLFLAGADEIENWDSFFVAEIEQVLFALEERASEKGWSPLPIYLRKLNAKEEPVQIVVEISSQMESNEDESILQSQERISHIALTVKYTHT